MWTTKKGVAAKSSWLKHRGKRGERRASEQKDNNHAATSLMFHGKRHHDRRVPNHGEMAGVGVTMVAPIELEFWWWRGERREY